MDWWWRTGSSSSSSSSSHRYVHRPCAKARERKDGGCILCDIMWVR